MQHKIWATACKINALVVNVMATRSFCFRKARYVKYVENHSISNCLHKRRSKDVKCVLREGNHLANYKNCMVYKDLQRSTKKVLPCIMEKSNDTQTTITN
jgi:hypothetical protein